MSQPKKLGQTEIKDITDKIPSNLPTPKIEPVKVDPTPNIDRLDASLTVGEWLGRLFRGLGEGLTQVSQAVADVAKIVTFVQTWWIPVAVIILIVAAYFIFK
jgi:hypothetical protein